jgi:arylsulfatase
MVAENQKFIGVQEGKDGKAFYFPAAMTDQAIDWLHGVRGHDASKPWFMYYSTGCSHAPHHVSKEWSAKYKGRFDQGWDRLREETFARQKALGVVPADAQLTPRHELMPAWDSLSENSKRLFAHQMEVYAGYSENADHHVGRLLDAIEEMGELDNTVVMWIWGDNGASLEGTPTGTFNEGTMVNGLPLTDEEQMQLALKWGWAGGLGHRDDVPALLHRVGVGGEHAVPVGQAGRLAPQRHPQPAGRPLAAGHRGPGRAALAVHACVRPGPDDPGDRRDPPAHPCRRRRAAAHDRGHLRRRAE